MVKLAEVEDEVEQDTVLGVDASSVEPVQLVVISDIHVNPWSQFASGTGLSNSRMQQTLEVLDQSLRDAAERDRVWLCAGDLFHTSGRVKNEVLNATVGVLSRYPEVRKLIVFGNHDSRSRGASEVETEETAIRTLCEAVDNCRLLHRDVENLSFPDRGVLSIYGEGAQTRPSNLQVTPPRPADVGIFHQLVDGSLTPKGRTLEGDVLEKDLSDPFHLTIVGDVHHPQYRWEDGDLFLVPGAPEQHNFGDEGDERGWWIVEMEMGRDEDGWHPSDLTFRESDSPRFVTVESQDEVDPEANAFYRVQGGTVDEDTLPTNAEVLGSPPTTVKQRDVLVDGAGLRDTLLAWMEEVEPDGDRADYLERAETLLEDADHAIPRPARLKTVEARDFGSYRDLSYDIRDGVNLIVGDARDYDSNGCLSGGTFVDVPRDLSENPYGVKIKNLVGSGPFPVYAMNPRTGRIELTAAEWAKETGKQVSTVRVTFTSMGPDGQFRPPNELVLTEDHPVMLRSGVYKEAGDLESGDRLMPLYRRLHGQYPVIMQPIFGERSVESRLIGEYREGRKLDEDEHAHHINGLKVDNRPENISVLEESEHLAVHGVDRPPTYEEHPRGMAGKSHSQDTRERISETMRKEWEENKDQRIEATRQAVKDYWSQFDRPWTDEGILREFYLEREMSTVEIAEELNCADGTVGRWLDRYDIPRRSISDAQSLKNKDAPWRDEDRMRKLYLGENKTGHEVAEIFGCSPHTVYKWLRRHDIEVRPKGADVNHRVTGVEEAGTRDVYDIRVPGYDNFVSNGVVVHNSGKSTLMDMVYYALFGETTKGVSAGREIRDERAGDGADSCMVRLEIDVDGQDVVVIRERSPSGPSLEVQIDGEDLDDDEEITGSSIREMTNALGNLLGLTPEIYKALSYYSQIDTLRLSESTDAERKDLLSELCGLQSFERASSTARSEAKEIDQAIGRTRERIARDQSDLEEAEERLEQKREEAASWEEEHSEKIEKAEDELAYLEDTARAEVFGMRDRLSSIRSRADDLKDLWRERREAEQDDLAERLAADRREDLEERLVRARPDVDDGRMERAHEMVESMGEIKERLSEASQALDERKSDWEAAKSDVRNLKREAKKRRRAVEEAEAMEPGDECPECGQDLDPDHVDKVRSQAEERRDVVESNLKERRARARGFKERVDEAKEKVERLEHRLGECQSAEKFLVKVERQREKVQSLEERLEEVEEAACEKAASRINNRILRDEARIDSLVERAEAHVREAEQYLEQRISRTEDRLEALEEQENPHESAVEELESRVEGLESRIESAESGLEGKREEQRIYEYWADGLSKRGVQGLLLEEIAAEFNRTRSRVFPLLTGGRFDVQFSTTSETQAGEKREKTEFVIRDRGMEIEYADLSGGERRRVDLGVMICLSLATARMHGIPGVLGLQIYDEVFGFLDDVGAETVVEVLEEITDTIPSIYVITQDDGMRAHFDQVIEVRQGDDGISRVA